MENLTNYVSEEALIIIPVLLILGKILKNTAIIPDWTIPYFVLVLGIVLALAVVGFNVDAVIQGVLVSGIAVFTHQLIKQPTKKELNR